MLVRIAVTNRNICYNKYKKCGIARENTTALDCLSEQIYTLIKHGFCDKILIREKDLSESEYRKFTYSICASKQLTYINSRIILHNFPNVAEELATDLHLSFSRFTRLFASNNISIKDFRAKYQNIPKIGTSVHSIEDAIFAETQGADYIIAGHVFSTDCKKGIPERGVDWLHTVCDAVSIPVYAIGGITNEKITLMSQNKISGYCMMSGFMDPYSNNG